MVEWCEQLLRYRHQRLPEVDEMKRHAPLCGYITTHGRFPCSCGAVNERKVAPGLYIAEGDGRTDLHVDIPELLEHFGYADTPENRDVCTREAMKVFARLYPDVPRHEV